MEKFACQLLSWYKNNNRSYPWRRERSPYRIMVAEFMLQRTRADQVLPIYREFVKRYPDVQSLSVGNEEDIKEILKPLGLFWRAAHFKKAAQYIIKEYGGIIPSNRDELLKIPGVGDYVSGAILAVAFSKSTNIVDSNIARVLNRYCGLRLSGEIRRNKTINDLSFELFKQQIPKKILFAIIDFSAIICTPSNPKHELCPVKSTCRYYQELLRISNIK